MTYRRLGRYPETLRVPVTEEMKSRLQAAAEAEKWPVAELVRQAVEAGLPVIRERQRSRRRSAARREGAQ